VLLELAAHMSTVRSYVSDCFIFICRLLLFDSGRKEDVGMRGCPAPFRSGVRSILVDGHYIML
jgi:hypothetical protein